MGICCVPECIRSFCFDEHFYQGNKIFKKINTKLNTKNQNLTPKEQSALQNCINLLEEMEKERLDIANKFKSFLENTGACALTQPTMERGLITFIIYLIAQILICAKEKNIEFKSEDFSLINFISITKEVPFICLNQNILENLKNKYSFDFNMINTLIKGKDSIIEFLSTIPKAKLLFENQIAIIKKLTEDKIMNIYIFDEIIKSLDGIKFLFDFFSEITSGIVQAQSEISNPQKFKLFYEIAEKAAERKLKDPREIALFYSEGDNCGNIDNWNENMIFKEIKPTKY